MAVFDWLGHAWDWTKKRWNEDWKDFGDTFSRSWTQNVPNAFRGINKAAGQLGFQGPANLATYAAEDDADLWSAMRGLADSSLNLASGLLGGTLGTLFQVPILHEASWLLDKAYRYTIARPMATPYLMITNTQREAFEQGKTNPFDQIPMLLNFNTLARAWEDSEYVTPGQALTYAAHMNMQMWGAKGDYNKVLDWMTLNDPRTPGGQQNFSGPEANFWLKYTSGTLDFATSIAGDPAQALSMVSKAARLRYVDKVADQYYINTGKVVAETGGSQFDKLFAAFKNAPNSEAARQLTMLKARKGGQMSTILWASAKMGKDVFRDAYLAMRAGDEAAFGRLLDLAPEIAEGYSHMFARHTIADFDFQRGQLANMEPGADALRKTAVSAFVDSMTAREGLWGKMTTYGQGEAMPKVSALSAMRAGYHSKVLAFRPVVVGRVLSNLMPSQGWTQRINPSDGTAMGLNQFRANLERAGIHLTPDELEKAVSQYGAATSDAIRHTVAMRVEERIVSRMLTAWGIKDHELKFVLDELNRWRTGQRKIWGNDRRFISEEAAKSAERLAAQGRDADAIQALKLSKDYMRLVHKGDLVDNWVAMTDADGAVNMVPVHQDGFINRNEPILRSQFADAITMLDYRALNGALRWYKITHPVPKTFKYLDEAGKEVSTKVPVDPWRTLVAQVAKLRGPTWDLGIGILDTLSGLWKSTALLRPAQMPRNISDDVLRTYIEFGRLPLLLALGNGIPNMFKNYTARGELLHDAIADKVASWRGKNGRMRPVVEHEADTEVPNNVALEDAPGSRKYLSPGNAWVDGVISMRTYIEMLNERLNLPSIQPEAVRVSTRYIWLGQMRETAPYSIQMANGPTPLVEAMLMRQFHNGEFDYHELARNLALVNVTTFGRDTFRQTRWGTDIIKRVVQQHVDRHGENFYIDDPYNPATVVVDPFTGMEPKDLVGDLREHFDISHEGELNTRNIPKKKKGSIQSVMLSDPANQMRAFIASNADELMRPDTLLSLRVRPNGNISIGFARTKETSRAVATVKASARDRLKDFSRSQIKDMAHTGFSVKLGNGRQYDFTGVFEGDTGQAYQQWVSAAANPSVAFQSLVSDTDVARMMGEQGSWGENIRPDHKDYGSNWERAVNAQIASDPVAARFLAGKTDSQVISEVESTAWGTKWVSSMAYRGVSYVDQIRQIEAMVDLYVPRATDGNGMNAAKAEALRRAVLEKKATYEQLKDAFPEGSNPMDVLPEIHGVSVEHVLGFGYAFDQMKKLLRMTQKLLADMPTDKIARFPFMAMAYKKYATDMVHVANKQFGDGPIPARIIGNIKEAATERAYYDVRYRLFDTAQRNDLASALRFFMPFSSAMMDSYIKYGRNIRQNPMLLVQGAYYWDVFERNGMVQDENGHVAKQVGGHVEWWSVDPKTGEYTRVPDDQVGKERFIQFQMPSALAKALGVDAPTYYGVKGKTVLAVNKDTMNVFLNLPGAGPLVALPANEFALDNPEFGENEMVRKYLLPFGPSVDRGKAVLPSTVRNAWDAFLDKDADTASGHAQAIMQAELTAYALGQRDTPPSFEEVRQRAAALQVLRFKSSFFSPASFQVVDPYQPYVDAYRQLVQADPTKAAERFQAKYGDEYYAMSMSVTRNAAGITASLNSYKAYQAQKDLISMYPEFGSLIVGRDAGGEFAKSVYEAQKETPLRNGSNENLRSMMSLEESVDDLQKKTTWSKYSQMMDLIRAAMVDRGLTDLQSRAAKDLKDQRDSFVDANKYWQDPSSGEYMLSPWYRDYKSNDASAWEHKLEAMARMTQNEQLMKRDDIRGLSQYLALRVEMREFMGKFKLKTLDSRAARNPAQAWNRDVHALIEQNPAFGDLWARYLSNDMLDVDMPESVYAVGAYRGH